ncbi:MAG: Mur ligase family protein, partial [Bacillota bacterium]
MKEILAGKTLEEYSGITNDSREVTPGDIFVAIKGYETDGNLYINEAVKKGAALVFTDQKMRKNRRSINGTPIIQVDNSRKFLGKLAAAFYHNPSDNLQLIGVTGTNGKTTTNHLIYQLLNYNAKRNQPAAKPSQKAGIIGSIYADNGREITENNLTTPDSITLQKYMDEMVKNNLKYCCLEVSSHGIKLNRIEGSNFSVKVGTNISADHLDLHPTFAAYKSIKRSFLEDDSDTLVLLNKDNKFMKSFDQIAKNQFDFAIINQADVNATKINELDRGYKFMYSLNSRLITHSKKEISPFTMSLKMHQPGLHNIYNALTAITIALYYDTAKEIIQDFLKEFKGIKRRLQFVCEGNYTIIDDYAHNPKSYQSVLKAVSRMRFNKLIIVNSIRGNRG